MNNVIGPIDQPTWYCMRQCSECIKYLTNLKNPIYDVEIKGEKEMLKHFMHEVLHRH